MPTRRAVAQAPSKVIITGEHFVVHGAWALAAAVGRKVRVEVRPSASLDISSDKFGGRSKESLSPAIKVVEALAKEYSFRPNLSVSISSDIPDGAGLGSSASTMVALTSAVSRSCALDLSTDELVKFSMVGEREVHGNPSGIDPTVCAEGGAILFRPGEKPRPVPLPGSRRFIVVYSGKKRNTGRLVSHVAVERSRMPNFFGGLADSVGDLSIRAAELLSAGDMGGLGRLLNLNQAVLSGVGVSTPDLDMLVDLLISLGCDGAKLTGAGGGGSVVAVAPEGKEKRIIPEVSARGFEAFVAEIPVEGVKSWLER